MTVRASMSGQQPRQFFAQGLRVGFPVTAFKIGDHTFKRVGLDHLLTAITGVVEVNVLLAAAMQNDLLYPARQLLPGRFQLKAIMLSKAFE